MRFLSVIGGLMMVVGANAQAPERVDAKHCDCENALTTDDGKFGLMTMPQGYGAKQEIKGYSIKQDRFPTKEHNTLWIKFEFRADTEFEFQLSPEIANDDFDFIIWKSNGGSYCDSIKSGVQPIRSNLSRRNPEQKSITGLKHDATNLYAAAGPNPTFSKSIEVHEGEVYYMLIDCPYGTQGGFSSEFNYLRDKEPEIVEEPAPVVKVPKIYIEINTDDGEYRVKAEIKLRGLPATDSMYFEDGQYIISRARKFKTYLFDIDKKGYKQLSKTFLCRVPEDTVLRFKLEKLRVGSKLEFRDINFEGDAAAILEESEPDLAKLINFLNVNPNINVEVGGHVNGIGRGKKLFKKLSNDRAEAVYKYLVNKGIQAERITFKGYGASKMLHPTPQNEMQAKANRRVELRVTKL